MKFTMLLFLAALGLMFFLEGLLYFVGARHLRPFFLKLAETEPDRLRLYGLGGMLAGTTCVALVRMFF